MTGSTREIDGDGTPGFLDCSGFRTSLMLGFGSTAGGFMVFSAGPAGSVVLTTTGSTFFVEVKVKYPIRDNNIIPVMYEPFRSWRLSFSLCNCRASTNFKTD